MSQLLAWLALASLLLPALVCTIPGASMGGSTSDCCAHMTSHECQTANMSACCEVAPNPSALVPVGSTSKQVHFQLDQVLLQTDLLFSSPQVAYGLMSLHNAQPPQFSSGSALPVLRI